MRAPAGFQSRTERIAAPLAASSIGGSLADFLNALDTGATPMGECHDNIKSVAMVFGALESAARRQRVVIAS